MSVSTKLKAIQETYIARAFNRGADARIAGEPMYRNPCTDRLARKSWDEGWLDVDQHWPKDGPPLLTVIDDKVQRRKLL